MEPHYEFPDTLSRRRWRLKVKDKSTVIVDLERSKVLLQEWTKRFRNSEPFIHNQRILVVLFRWFKILWDFTDCFKLHLDSKLTACLLLTSTRLYCMDLQSSFSQPFGNVYTWMQSAFYLRPLVKPYNRSCRQGCLVQTGFVEYSKFLVFTCLRHRQIFSTIVSSKSKTLLT